MKKIILCAAFCLLAASTASAQIKYPSYQSFGVKAGPTLSYQRGNDPKAGFTAGMVFEIYRPYNMGFTVELLYAMQGYRGDYVEIKNEDQINHGEADFTMQYMNIPIMLSYDMGRQWLFNLGVQLGVLLDAKVQGNYQGKSYERDVKSYKESVYFSFPVGISKTFGPKIITELRYNFSIMSADRRRFNSDTYVDSFAFTIGKKF